MTDLNLLLALSAEERKEIAEKLWSSLPAVNEIASEDQAVLDLLEDRWQSIKEGKSQVYSSQAAKALLASKRTNK